MSYYEDLREYLKVLEENQKLWVVDRRVVKETEIMPLVRLQFRGLREEERRAFLFNNVTDVKGRSYDARVAIGILAASRDIYALGMMCKPDEIMQKWAQAQLHPIQPVMVDDGPVHEVVDMGSMLYEEGKGVEKLPAPVELPGFSGQIRTTTHIVTKDPETGIQNSGTYSGHFFGKTKILCTISRTNHGFIHWEKARQKGIPLEAAILVGSLPNIAYTANARIPYGIDEFTVSGGLAGEPVKLVKCKTVDLEVPANTEVVIEGVISTDYLEPVSAFGEYTGYMAVEHVGNLVMKVTAVTHRRNPIFNEILSQMPPSESSKMRELALQANYYKFLRYDCNIPGLLDVAFFELPQDKLCVIKIKKTHHSQAWQALYGAAGFTAAGGKIFIATDPDIDIKDLEAVFWALSWRMQPHRDIKVLEGRHTGLDLSGTPMDAPEEDREYPEHRGTSILLIDATLKWPYPPVALPAKEYMEQALHLWEELELPKLNLKTPWYGYELGYWSQDDRENADLTLKGEHYKIGQKLESRRIKPEQPKKQMPTK